jgi:hypothetical protein
VAHDQQVVDAIKAQDFRAAVKEHFYHEMGVTDGMYPTKEEIYNYLIAKHFQSTVG